MLREVSWRGQLRLGDGLGDWMMVKLRKSLDIAFQLGVSGAWEGVSMPSFVGSLA